MAINTIGKKLSLKSASGILSWGLLALLITYPGLTMAKVIHPYSSIGGSPNTRDETITGTVTDSNSGEPLIGVNILLKGSSTGTVTDTDGSYELTVSSLRDSLVFSYVGYEKKIVAINGRTTIDIEMTSQAISGEELVVVRVWHGQKERSYRLYITY